MKILFVFLLIVFQLEGFPGDHIPLTCIKHLAYKYDPASGKLVKDEVNLKKYLDNAGSDPNKILARQDAVKAIHKTLKDYPAFFEDPAIITEIKKSIKDNGYNKDVPITKWGDSLSDWIDHYGWLPYSIFNYGVMNISNQSRCFQGQIYRSSFNDCKGTGDASNNYGAQLLQFCYKSDFSCIREPPYLLTLSGKREQ